MTEYALADALRGMSVCLFMVVVGQVGYVIVHYLRVVNLGNRLGDRTSGILPRHVTVLGTVLIGFAAECVAQNVIRIGEPLSYFAVLNPILLLTTIWGLRLIQTYERLRYQETRALLLRAQLSPQR